MTHLSETSPASLRPRRIWLGILVVAWGFQAIVTQSLLLREALVLMFGSEFAWGVVLFAWLFGVAVGAIMGGWCASRLRRADVVLVVVLFVLGAAACLELWVFRGARAWLRVEPGELLPLSKTALAAMAFISPAGVLVGMAFPLACRMVDDTSREEHGDAQALSQRGAGPLADIYALESLGSLIGGAAFSFWMVEHLAPIETALVCVAITAAASAGLLATTARKRIGAACLATVAVAALLLAVFAGDTLNHRLVLRRWRNVAPGYELCAEVESKYQNLAVGRRAEQFTLYCDGHVSADFPDPYTFVPLAHFWMCQHPAPRRVLVLGGGAEGLLAEILRHPIEHVDTVEPDARQIELIKPYLDDADRLALDDERVTVHHLDARYFVKTQRDRFDLVIARLPEPTSALRARFYTDEFYRELRKAMTEQSVLCMTAAATSADLPAASADYLASIRATLRRHFPQVVIGWGASAQVLAATEAGLLSVDPTELAARYSRRGIRSPLFHPLWFEGATDWLDPVKLQARSEQLDAAVNVEVSTDLHPTIYMQRLALWEQMTSGQSGRIIERLQSVGWPELVGALVAVAVVTMAICRLRGKRRKETGPAEPRSWVSTGAIVLSVGTTGFATMALSIIWLFAFQNLYGYVYQRIGWIIALFMGGLVIGCRWVSVRSKRIATSPRRVRCADRKNLAPSHPSVVRKADPTALSSHLWRWLIGADVLIALLALAVPFILPALGAVQNTRLAFVWVEWAVSILVALTGVLCGAAFALAGGLQLAATGRADGAAASVVGADHAGACAGALLTGMLLIPVFGTAAAAFLLVGVKLGSAGLLLLGRRFSHGVR